MIWSVVVESFRERQPYLAGRIVKEELKSIAIPDDHLHLDQYPRRRSK
jgi:hypothetical protein